MPGSGIRFASAGVAASRPTPTPRIRSPRTSTDQPVCIVVPSYTRSGVSRIAGPSAGAGLRDERRCREEARQRDTCHLHRE